MAKRKKNQITFVHKVPLSLDRESAACLDGQSKITNKLYNLLKEKADVLRVEFARAMEAGQEERGREIGLVLYTERGLRNLVPDLKIEKGYLTFVHSSPLKNVALRLSRAIKAHQDSRHGRRAGPAVAWPRFHAWKREWTSLEYDEPGKGWKLVDGTKLKLSFGRKDGKRLGITAGLVEPPPGIAAAKCLRIIKEQGGYFALFTIVKHRKKPRAPRPSRIAYIDPNSSNMGVSLDTLGRSIQIENIPGLVELDRRIDSLKNQRDRKKRNSRLVKFTREDGTLHRHFEASRRWKTLNRALHRLEHRRRERIKQVLYSTAHAFFDHYDVVGIGDWAPANDDSGLGRKANRTLRSRRYLGKFRSILSWVALKRRKMVLVLDETGTTRTCSACGHVMEGGIPPSVRRWECPGCHIIHGRDENAATNGLRRLLHQLESSPGSNLPGSGLVPPTIGERCTWSASPGAPRKRKRFRSFRRVGLKTIVLDQGIKGSARMGGRGKRAAVVRGAKPRAVKL